MTSQLKAISYTTTTDVTTEANIHPIRSTAKKQIDKPACNRCGYRHTPNKHVLHMVQSAASAVERTTLQRFADIKLPYQASIPLYKTTVTIHLKIYS